MIRISGHSDDIIEIDVHGASDEIGAFSRPVAITIKAKEAIQGCRVIGEYAPGDAAVWRFAVEQIDEDVPMPWPVRFAKKHGYSLEVQIDAPPDVTVEWAKEPEETPEVTP